MPNLYVDCSHLSRNPHLRTGIQRVVRRVSYELTSKLGPNDRVILTDLAHNNCAQLSLSQLEPGRSANKRPVKQRLKHYLHRLYNSGRDFTSAVFGDHPLIHNFLVAPRNKMGLSFLIDKIFIAPIVFLSGGVIHKEQSIPSAGSESIATGETASQSSFDNVRPGDVVLLIDSSWFMNIWPTVLKLRSRGAKVYMVAYDIIPISHPEFCDDFLSAVFRQHLRDSLACCDGYIGISRTVSDDVKNYLASMNPIAVAEKTFDYFYLGSDFDGGKEIAAADVRIKLKTITASRPCYSLVSTLEPRKNHSYLIDAFEDLWGCGIDVNLVFAGRPGWKVEELIQRIRRHREYGRRLFWFDDLSDPEVSYLYKHSRALLFPSIVEGFGLPIVEGLASGLTVLASNIPVHREIGGEQIGYFDLCNPSSLTSQIIKMEQSVSGEGVKEKGVYNVMTWSDSVEMLLDAIRFPHEAQRGKRG